MQGLTYQNIFNELYNNMKHQNNQAIKNEQSVALVFKEVRMQNRCFFIIDDERISKKVLLFDFLFSSSCLQIVLQIAKDHYRQMCIIQPQCMESNIPVSSDPEERKQQLSYIPMKNIQLSIPQGLQRYFTNGRKYYLKKYYYNDHIYKTIVSKDQNKFVKREIRSQPIFRMLRGQNIQNRLDQTQIKEPPIGGSHEIDKNQNEAHHRAKFWRLMMITGSAGTGKTRISCKIAHQIIDNLGDLKVLLTTVTHTGVASLCKQFIKQLDQLKKHDRQIIKDLSNFIKIFPNIEDRKKRQNILTPQQIRLYKKMMEEQIKHGLNQTYIEGLYHDYRQISNKNIVYFIPLLSHEQYSALNPIERYYQLNTHIIRNILKEKPDYCLEQLLKHLNTIAKGQILKLPIEEQRRFHQLYLGAVRRTIRQADCILIQTSLIPYLNSHQKEGQLFQPHTVFLDEAGTATINDVLACLYLQIKQLILAGDTHQLNIFDENLYWGANLLKQKVFSILMERYKQNVIKFNTNYRNNQQIIAFLSNNIYENMQIKTSAININQEKLYFFQQAPIQMVHYQDYFEDQANNGYYNLYQIAMIKMLLKNFQTQQLEDVGIITFYKQQQKKLREALQVQIKYGLQVKTVDGFQGGQKKYIFISLVRSRYYLPIKDLSHINDQKRFTVALSRAITSLTIIGNIRTVMSMDLKSKKHPWINAVYYLIKRQRLYHLYQNQQAILKRCLTKIKHDLYKKKEQIADKHYIMDRPIQNEEEIEDKQKKEQNNLNRNYLISQYPFLQYRHRI